ncbi:RNA polymerase sigma factor [Synoicihabitans lomoniglobus]|uniref:RNA polymerase sigma factor n=1 Tax=Synoicihabitans lomoniglobus TaxID=2909285 RepID=A0AAF0CNL9_9BACT|nr:sigma-70 family RNA polymerase sigma factor [Opitutaceae bacterium LMO-M01]WED64701.1 sigma-70 family RNA polymerase sigma factor [Opitutaceae bacterium LMO-M01]
MNTLALDTPLLKSNRRRKQDDATLVARFQRGDEDAFAQIVEAYRTRIHGYVRGMLRDSTDAEEVTQDTFVRAYRGLERFRGDSSLSTWLHRIATNLARNRYWYFFRRRRQDTVSLDFVADPTNDRPVMDSIACESPDPSQQSTNEEFMQSIRDCMDQIEPRYREALTLRVGKDLPYAEIAEITGVPVGTVKSRIARARRELRDLLVATVPELAEGVSINGFLAAELN